MNYTNEKISVVLNVHKFPTRIHEVEGMHLHIENGKVHY